MARWTNWESRLPFKQDSCGFEARPRYSAAGCLLRTWRSAKRRATRSVRPRTPTSSSTMDPTVRPAWSPPIPMSSNWQGTRLLTVLSRFESGHRSQRCAGAHLVGGTCLIHRPRSGSIPTRRTSCPCSSTEERRFHTPKAGGSSPSAGTQDHGGCSSTAERRAVDSEAAGSSPASHPRWVRHRW